MKDNKDLHPFANKKLASVDIVLENCEVYNIPVDGIYKLSLGNIKYSFDVHVNGLSKYTTPGEMWTHAYTDFVWLALNKKGMNIDSGWVDMFDEEETHPFYRRVNANDITHLDFIFDDGSNLYVGVPWEDGNTEFDNKLQKNDIRDDILFIQIAEKQEISDNELKEINDGQEDIYHWDNDGEDDDILDISVGSINTQGVSTRWQSIPNYVQAAFTKIDEQLSRVMWNTTQEEYESPFSNTGNKFKNDVFEVEAYSWDDEYDQEYNFKWNDYKVRWYKHCLRDPEANREMSPDECAKMLDECLESIYKMDVDEDNLFDELCDSYDCHFCCQCGKEADKQLQNGKYACEDCLHNLGKEQQELKEEIENSLFDFGFDNYEDVTNCIDTFIDFIKYAKVWSTIENLDHLVKALEAININIKLENGLLDEETTEKIKEFAENW